MTLVTVAACPVYEPAAVRRGLANILEPLGGMAACARPGMRMLLVPLIGGP